MSASVSGRGLRDVFAGVPAGVVGLALTATLFVALMSAAPALADDVVPTAPPPTTDTLSGDAGNTATSADSVDTAMPAGGGQSKSASQSNTATNTQTSTTTGGNAGSATGGNAGPAQSAGQGSQSGSHGGNAYANGGRAESHTTSQNGPSQVSGGAGAGNRGDGGSNPGATDKFAIDTPKRQRTGGGALQTGLARYPAPFGMPADGVTSLEAKERLAHETAEASSLGGFVAGHRGPAPGRDPYLDLLSGPAGSGAVMLLSLFAVLVTSFSLSREWFEALRTRTVAWRPLAYVPPIELPG